MVPLFGMSFPLRVSLEGSIAPLRVKLQVLADALSFLSPLVGPYTQVDDIASTGLPLIHNKVCMHIRNFRITAGTSL